MKQDQMIRNIWAVGRNYADHAKEMQAAVPAEPMIFLKAGSCLVQNQTEFQLPPWSSSVHHEIELALQFDENLGIGKMALALDLTERDRQSKAKKEGLPWTMAKSFRGACPISQFINVKNINDLQNLNLKLWINDELKQNGNTRDMIFKAPQLAEYVVNHFPICPGDLLLTGTPSGVGPLQKGDHLRAELGDLIQIKWVVKSN